MLTVAALPFSLSDLMICRVEYEAALDSDVCKCIMHHLNTTLAAVACCHWDVVKATLAAIQELKVPALTIGNQKSRNSHPIGNKKYNWAIECKIDSGWSECCNTDSDWSESKENKLGTRKKQ